MVFHSPVHDGESYLKWENANIGRNASYMTKFQLLAM